jgi:hypothetical protein
MTVERGMLRVADVRHRRSGHRVVASAIQKCGEFRLSRIAEHFMDYKKIVRSGLSAYISGPR